VEDKAIDQLDAVMGMLQSDIELSEPADPTQVEL
jgi:hypothetical protein